MLSALPKKSVVLSVPTWRARNPASNIHYPADSSDPGADFGSGITAGLAKSDPRAREAIRQGMTDTARALSLAVDREVRIAVTGLRALATSPALLEGDYPTFREQVENFLTSHNGWISVVDQSGQ